MKRWTFLILICLFLGVVTTVGISWWILWTWDPETLLFNIGVTGYSAEDRSGWLVTFNDNNFGRTSISMQPASESDSAHFTSLPDVLPSWSLAHQPAPYGRAISIIEYAGGWPRLALHYKLTVDADQPNPEWIISGGFPTGASPILVADEFEKFRALPYIPIFPGILINTLLFGFIWFGLFFGISKTRRVFRRKRGQCPMCGYDLRGSQSSIGHRVLNPLPDSQAGRLRHQSAGCPECGWHRLETSKHPNIEKSK